MANSDLQLTIPIPHRYLTSYAVQSSVDTDRETLSKQLTEFRGYVISRGFDIESLLSEIITHLLLLNRPPYDNETENEHLFHLSCRGFIRDGLLGGQDFSFGRKISLLKGILDWIPKELKDGIRIPDFETTRHWRNKFAHVPIKLSLSEDHAVLPTIEVRKGTQTVEVCLTTEKLTEISEAMEACYAACADLEKQLCVRYGDARPNSFHGDDKSDTMADEVAAPKST